MALSPRNKSIGGLVLLGLLALSGCSTTEYMNRWDRVSTRAGNANEANTAIMEVPPSYAKSTSTIGG